jgi:dolichol-phosphate mannosyltransferase
MKLSVVIPAHNEAGSIAATVHGLVGALSAEGIPYEILVVDDASTDRTKEVVEGLTEADPSVLYLRSHNPRGFGYTVRSGLDRFTGARSRS